VRPTLTDDGRRAPALYLREPRVMVLLSALGSFTRIAHGFTNKALRQQVADLFDTGHTPYRTTQISCDLRRLRLKGIIWRIPHSYRHQLTRYGRKVVLFFAKPGSRIFRQFLAAIDDSQPVPLPLAAASEQVERAVKELVDYAHLAPMPA